MRRLAPAFAGERARPLGQSLQRRLTGGLITRGTGGGKAGNLSLADEVIVDLQRVELVFCGELICVDANDDIFALVHACLPRRGGFFDEALWHAGRNCLGHAAELVDFADYLPRLLDQFSRQRFDIIRATQWIDDLSNAALLGQHNLCIAGNARRKVGRQRYGFIQRIGVQRLRPT
jgi:hypothetical protein